MTPERYFEMQEQMGLEIVEEDIPATIEDLPEVAQQAISIFNMSGDRVYPDIGFMGKDYTNLKVFMDLHNVHESDHDFFFEVLLWLERNAIKQSSDQLKREHEKLKRKHSGGSNSNPQIRNRQGRQS